LGQPGNVAVATACGRGGFAERIVHNSAVVQGYGK
jgi:hypothetical protein